MSEINFFSEDTDFSFHEADRATEWLLLIGRKYKKEIGNLSIIFCSDTYLHQINVDYLQHDDLTDIITFPYEEKEIDVVSGDIFISVERVRENAAVYEVSMEKELKRVMAHGLLHLCGYKDKTHEEKTIMRHQEDQAIKLWDEIT